MSLLAHVGVKDEIELLPRCVAHLFAIGVDRIIVTDMGSTDGSLEWLQQESLRQPIQILRMDDRQPDSLQAWCTRVTEAVLRADADWTLFIDADEFPLPRSGRIQDCLALQTADVLILDRFNVPLGPHGPRLPDEISPANHARIQMLVTPVPDLHDQLAAGADIPWIRGVPGPKVLARTRLIGQVAIGGHDIEAAPGSTPRRARPDDLIIAHLPFSTRARFQSKVANLAGAIAANESFFAGRIGWHWQRWLRQWRAGELDAEFDRQVFSDALLQSLAEAGVAQDAAQWFARRAAGEPRP